MKFKYDIKALFGSLVILLSMGATFTMAGLTFKMLTDVWALLDTECLSENSVVKKDYTSIRRFGTSSVVRMRFVRITCAATRGFIDDECADGYFCDSGECRALGPRGLSNRLVCSGLGL